MSDTPHSGSIDLDRAMRQSARIRRAMRKAKENQIGTGQF